MSGHKNKSRHLFAAGGGSKQLRKQKMNRAIVSQNNVFRGGK